MMNKKAQFELNLTMIGIFLVLIIVASILFIFWSDFRFYVVGGTFVLMSLIFIINVNNKRSPRRNDTLIFLIMLLIGIFIIIIPLFGLMQIELGGTSSQNVVTCANGGSCNQLVVPHYGAYKCELIDSIYNSDTITSIGTSGVLLSQNTMGFYTDAIKEIDVNIDYGFWQSLSGDVRIDAKTCNKGTTTCTDKYAQYTLPGQKQKILDSIDLRSYDLYIYAEQCQSLSCQWNSLFGGNSGWTRISGATVSYSADKYGLTYYSTLHNPAGDVMCTSSCGLDCSEIKDTYKQYLLENNSWSIPIHGTASTFEYWESIPYDINTQYGAPVYNNKTGTFCFGGNIYSSAKLAMASGITYIYPDLLTVQHKLCCPGASLTTNGIVSICQSDYTWKPVTQDNRIPCLSDAQCPNGGVSVCVQGSDNLFYLLNYKCGSDHYCLITPQKAKVSCCPIAQGCASTQTCSIQMGYTCVGGFSGGGNVTNITIGSENNNEEKCIPQWYQESYTSSKTQWIIWPVWSKQVAYTGCKTAGWVMTVIVMIFISVIVVLVVLLVVSLIVIP